MKTFNKKLIIPLFITLLMTGCMPDSMTKFKKDEPKKAVTTPGTQTPTDNNGNAIDTSEFVDPTSFKYKIEQSGVFVTEINMKWGDRISLVPSIDGSVGDPDLVRTVFVNCSITPALPGGISLIKTATANGCGIFGTPINISTDAGAPRTYTVTLSYVKKDGGIGTISTNIALGIYEPIGTFNYEQNDKNLLTLEINSGTIRSATKSSNVDLPYVRSGFISSSTGTIGVIKFIDTDSLKVGVVKLTPLKIRNMASLGLPAGVEFVGLSSPKFISAAGGKSAKVIRAVQATNTIYVEMISTIPFTDGDILDNEKVFVSSTGADIEDSKIPYAFSKVANATRVILDNNIQYYTNWASISNFSRSYEVGVSLSSIYPNLEIFPTIPSSVVPENGVKFTVSPQLPDGLSINEDTGEITGQFNDLVEPTNFQVTAKNPISTATVSLSLSGIKKPKDLSYTTRQLVAVKNTSLFFAGENLIKPITPPLTRGVESRILRKYARLPGTDENTYKLSIDSTNGKMTAGSSLDSGNAFYSEKSFVPTTAVAPKEPAAGATPAEIAALEEVPVLLNYNIAINVVSATDFKIGGHVSTPQGAVGRIVGKIGNTLFVQSIMLTFPPVHVPFQERNGGVANTIGNSEVFADRTADTTITQIEANIVELPLTMTVATPGEVEFSAGSEVTSSGNLAGYVYSVDDTAPASPILRVNDITMNPVEPTDTTPSFRYNQIVTDKENLAVAPADYGTIENVRSLENVHILEVGKYTEIQANLSEGNGVSYSIDTTLPTGLTFDQKTGLISGTPTVRTTLKPYNITASNLMSIAYYNLQIEVRDYFKLTDSSGMSTAILHKYGSFKNSRECKINATDILNGNAGVDVRCFMDVEEKELHTTRLRFTTSTGAGICEFIQSNPYYLYKSPPIATSKTIHVRSACITAGMNGVPIGAVTTPPIAATACDGNYTNTGGLNCDSGSYDVITYTGTDLSSPADGDCDDAGERTVSTAVTVQCGGRAANCIEGPITDILSRNDLAAGFRGTVTASAAGLKSITQLSSPLSHGYKTTLSVANSTTVNSCLMTNDDADTWETYAGTLDPLDSPWAGAPFYTFTCLDGASDIQARIRLVVRDWNKSFKVNSFIDVDLPGAAPLGAALMNNNDPSFGKTNNDYPDWDDAYNGTVPSGYADCSTGTLVVPGAPANDYKFPGQGL